MKFSSCIGCVKWLLRTLWVPFSLSVLNLLVFQNHYAGKATFPFDFLGGYHSMAYAWYADGGFFSPPYWSPYTHFGYPTHLALQNSSFYPLLALLSAFHISYTYEVATVFQGFHVWLGSLGLYYFLKSFGINSWIAWIGAITYHLSSGFFSNAQHVDIIRGYCWLPWLLWVSGKNFVTGMGNWRRVFSGFIIFLFSVGSYPGIIVSSFYAVLYFVSSDLWGTTRKQSLQYLKCLAFSLGIALLLSSLKFLPFIALIKDMQPASEAIAVSKIKWINLLTLFFRSDIDLFLSYEISIRSIFISPTVIIPLFYCLKLSRNFWLGISMALISLAFAFDWSGLFITDIVLPGMKLSRFPFLDYRGIFHVSMILAASDVLQQVTSSIRCNRFSRQWFLRFGLSTIFLFFLTAIALKTGYQFSQIQAEVFLIFLCSLLLFLTPIWKYWLNHPKYFYISGYFCIVVASSLIQINHLQKLWYVPYYHPHLESVYEISYPNLFQKSATSRNLPLSERSPRKPRSFEISQPNLNPNTFNKSFYLQTFSSQGYDNGIKMQKRVKLMDSKSNPDFLDFMTGSSRVLLLDSGKIREDQELENCLKWLNCESSDRNSVVMKAFQISSATYQVNLKKSLLMIENELYYPGWTAKVCDRENSCKSINAHAFGNYSLRAWKMEAGEYTLRTSYQPPLMFLSWVFFWIGMGISTVLLSLDVRNLWNRKLSQ